MINLGGTKVAGLLPNRLITTKGPKGSMTLYLTFDDGPHLEYTLKLCDLLEKFDAKATFFCIGRNITRYPDTARKVLERGHLIANHSDTHECFSNQPLRKQLNEIKGCQSKITRLKPSTSRIFRAPEGKLNLSLLWQLKLKKWDIIHWSYDSMDFKKLPLESQLTLFRNEPVTDGDILLFHDDNQLAIDLLEILLPEWMEQGFRFGSL